MAHTNSTDNYGLPQWIGTDKPTFLGDFNSAFATIDTQMKANADAATTAVATANSADAVATSANTNATTALNTANSAATDAASAVSTATTANSTANTAATNASAALRASAANSIENLAPAYDATLTYAVDDLVTYIDSENSGKLYKCIVAVNSPMEFNVNYWDDVTTSEVYSPKYRELFRKSYTTANTFNEVAVDIYNVLSALNLSPAELANVLVIFPETNQLFKLSKYENNAYELAYLQASTGVAISMIKAEANGFFTFIEFLPSGTPTDGVPIDIATPKITKRASTNLGSDRTMIITTW